MLITGVKSRPTYTTLKPDLGGRYHLLFGQGDGDNALLRLLNEMPTEAPRQILYTPDALSAVDRVEKFRAKGLDLSLFPTQTAAIAALDGALARCTMGTRLYIAGSESFIGAAEQVAIKYNLNPDEVQREHCGSGARRVYCIHCKASNEDVKTNIVKCVGCGRHLVVRDHYSRRLASYMGVMVDAEAPGEIPPMREVFA
jgi:hypothetical protein